MKPIPSRSTQRREALYALAMAENMPDAGVLDDIVRQYPQFSRELTEFAVELALESLVEGGAPEAAADPTKVSPAVSRAMSAFHNRLYALRRAGGAAVAEPTPSSDFVENPFSALGRREFRAVAEGIGANTVLVAKLRDRQVDPTTISDGFNDTYRRNSRYRWTCCLRTWRPARRRHREAVSSTRPTISPGKVSARASLMP